MDTLKLIDSINIKSEEEAKQQADLLAGYMKDNLGGDWQSSVWYNMYWCWNVKLGSIGLTYHGTHGTSSFSAMINDEINHTGGSPAFWFDDDNCSSDPVEAVNNAMRTAQKFIDKVQTTINDNKLKIFKDAKEV